MKSKLLKAGLCALVACGCLTGCAEESAAKIRNSGREIESGSKKIRGAPESFRKKTGGVTVETKSPTEAEGSPKAC